MKCFVGSKANVDEGICILHFAKESYPLVFFFCSSVWLVVEELRNNQEIINR